MSEEKNNRLPIGLIGVFATILIASVSGTWVLVKESLNSREATDQQIAYFKASQEVISHDAINHENNKRRCLRIVKDDIESLSKRVVNSDGVRNLTLPKITSLNVKFVDEQANRTVAIAVGEDVDFENGYIEHMQFIAQYDLGQIDSMVSDLVARRIRRLVYLIDRYNDYVTPNGVYLGYLQSSDAIPFVQASASLKRATKVLDEMKGILKDLPGDLESEIHRK